MRKHRFHLPELQAGIRVVTGSEAAHLTQVLRVASGSMVKAFDGKGNEAEGMVVEAEAARVVVELRAPQASGAEADLAVTVAVGLLKGDKLSDVVRQCTELGAVRFLPLLAKRRDVPELSANKLERVRRVAREAAKQSGRSVVPEVSEALPLSSLTWRGTALVAHPHATASLLEAGSEHHDEVTIITGPEGGFEAEEVAELEGRGARTVRMGSRILRAETAPVALLAALLIPAAV